MATEHSMSDILLIVDLAFDVQSVIFTILLILIARIKILNNVKVYVIHLEYSDCCLHCFLLDRNK